MKLARFWTECDICRTHGVHTVSSDSTSDKARKESEKLCGWARLRRDGKVVDACPDCVKLKAGAR